MKFSNLKERQCKELNESSTIRNFRIVQKEGSRHVENQDTPLNVRGKIRISSGKGAVKDISFPVIGWQNVNLCE